MIPIDQISTGLECLSLNHISGAIYILVPTWSSKLCVVFPESVASYYAESPKSMIFTDERSFRFSSNIFSGFISLWIMSFLWMYSTPEAKALMNFETSSSVNFFPSFILWSIKDYRWPPRIHSITRIILFAVSTILISFMIFGCFNCFKISDSFLKNAIFSLLNNFLWTIFTAKW